MADSFRRSQRGWKTGNGLTAPIEALQLFHSFQRSEKNAGMADSFRRSQRGWKTGNGLTAPIEALQLFHSFRRSRESAGNADSFRRSQRGWKTGNDDSFRRSRECAGNDDTCEGRSFVRAAGLWLPKREGTRRRWGGSRCLYYWTAKTVASAKVGIAVFREIFGSRKAAPVLDGTQGGFPTGILSFLSLYRPLRSFLGVLYGDAETV